MTTLIILAILFLILNVALLLCSGMFACIALKVYTEMAKERAMQIRASMPPQPAAKSRDTVS